MIAIGCDHGGYALKLHIIDYLEKKGFEYKDFGCHGTASVDYPDYALPVAEAVASGEAEGNNYMRNRHRGEHCCQQGARRAGGALLGLLQRTGYPRA